MAEYTKGKKFEVVIPDDPKRDVIVDCERPEITDEMVERAYEAYKRPNRMLTNTSDGNIKDRLEAALEAALGGEQA